MKKIFLAILLIAITNPVMAFTAIVERVSDGDTIVVKNTDGESSKIRLYGVDTPESKQLFGSQATRFTSGAVLHKTVKIQKVDVDRYGRIVAIVYTENGEILNEKLVENGHAWVYEKYCDIEKCDAWKEKQDVAMAQQKGLWQDSDPIAPWVYRKSKRN